MIRRAATIAAAVTAALVLAACGDATGGPRSLPRPPGGGGMAETAIGPQHDAASDARTAGGPAEVRVEGRLAELADRADAHRLRPAAGSAAALASALGLAGRPEPVDGGAVQVSGGGRTLRVERSGRFGLHEGGPDGVACARAEPDGSVSDEPCSEPAGPVPPPACDPAGPCSTPPGAPAHGTRTDPGVAEPDHPVAGQGGGASTATGPTDDRPADRPPTKEPAGGGHPAGAHPEPVPPEERSRPAPPEATRGAAAERARAVTAAIGVDAAEVEVQPAGTDLWAVRVLLAEGGIRAEGWELHLAVDTGGTVRHATGHVGAPARLGSYRLAGVQAGIDRLRGGAPGAGPDIAMPAIACADPDCRPAFAVTGVRLGLQLVEDGHETLLVPVYAFALAGGGEVLVPAVADSHLR